MVTHPSDINSKNPKEYIIAGIEKDALTLVYADDTERIRFCLSPEDKNVEKVIEYVVECVEQNKVFEGIRSHAIQMEVTVEKMKHIIFLDNIKTITDKDTGFSEQDYLHDKCQFKGKN